MYTYRSICRFKMLVMLGSEILEVFPGQVIKSKRKVNNSLLKLLDAPKKKIIKKKEKPKSGGNINASSF